MKQCRHRKVIPLIFALVAAIFGTSDIAHGQGLLQPEVSSTLAAATSRNVIIIGFVGGFVSQADAKHPEVQFAAYLRDRYPTVHAEVFGNHHGRKALHQVLSLLDTDHDGSLSSIERERATIIIYGHSWGASETVTLARKLGQMDIPVKLTIQIDTIAKPGRKSSPISSNVASAINFYQTGGPLHGRQEIFAVDPARTKIIGNIHMTYQDRPINCDNYSWYARTFNRPHHEIENDFRVWDKAASLIDLDLPRTASISQAPSLPSGSPFFKYLRRGFQTYGTGPALLEPSSEGTDQ